MADLLDATALVQRLGQFTSGLFRLETLPVYAVESDGDDYRRWLAGEPEPDLERRRRWLDALRARRTAGKTSTRVRLLSELLTDYERYECEWGYPHTSAAGEDIRVLRRGEHDIPALREVDFWVIDDAEALLMHYDAQGRFEGAEITTDDLPAFLHTRNVAWAAAEPFDAWWSRHTELRRAAV